MAKETLSLEGRCATCTHWQGDKKEAARMLKDDPISMDLFKGWPNDAVCGIDYEWLNTDIECGDARVIFTVDANFGCVYWSADKNG